MDYSLTNQEVFTLSQMTEEAQCFLVAGLSIIDDTLVEGQEIFSLVLNSNDGDIVIGELGTAVVTIMDNDRMLPLPNLKKKLCHCLC